jgi:hypothetical protein
MKKSQTMSVWLTKIVLAQQIVIKCAPLAGAPAIMANVHAPLAGAQSLL